MDGLNFIPPKNSIAREDYSKIFSENIFNREELIRKISCTISGSKRACKYFFDIEGEEKFFYLHYFSFYFNKEGNKDYAEILFAEMEKEKYNAFHKLNFLKRIGDLRMKNKKYYAKLFYILIEHNYFRSAFGALVNFYALNDRKLSINIDESRYREFLMVAGESNDNILIDNINLEVRNITFLANTYDINMDFTVGKNRYYELTSMVEKYSEEKKLFSEFKLPELPKISTVEKIPEEKKEEKIIDLFTKDYNIFRVKKIKSNEQISKDGNYAKRKNKIDEINAKNEIIYREKLAEKEKYNFIYRELKNKIERIAENKTKSKFRFKANFDMDIKQKSWDEINRRK